MYLSFRHRWMKRKRARNRSIELARTYQYSTLGHKKQSRLRSAIDIMASESEPIMEDRGRVPNVVQMQSPSRDWEGQSSPVVEAL